MADCKCGCGIELKGNRKFVDKEHQLAWMLAGGARELNALLPSEVRVRGGQTAGNAAKSNGVLAEASKKGADRVRELTKEFHARKKPPNSEA